MKCDEARGKLSDYIDGLLSAEDAALMRSHMEGCRECRAALSELEKTVGHIRNLKEVEPPAWLTQKVMARVKEEAGGERGIWEKLFRPLYIKLPLEAAAAVVIAVTALYIFNMTPGGLKTAGSRPPEIREESVPEGGHATAKGAETAESKSMSKPENVTRNEPAPLLHTEVPKTEIASRQALKEGGTPVPQQEKPASTKGLLPGPPASAPSMEVERSKAPAGAAVGYEGEATRDVQKEKAPMTGAVAPAKEAITADHTGAYSMKKAENAASPARIPGEAISIALEVNDPVKAVEEVKKALAKLGGRITVTEALRDRTTVTVDLDSRRIGELFEELKSVGEFKEKEPYALSQAGTLTIKIDISKRH